jgi:hypothetical protein
MVRFFLAVLCLTLSAIPAAAQTPLFRPGMNTTDRNPQPVKLMCWNATTPGYEPCPMPTASTTASPATSTSTPTTTAPETYKLITANVAAAPVTVQGGTYLLTQTCSFYGSVSLKVLGPDGVSLLTLVTKILLDTGIGNQVVLGAGSVVSMTVAGATGCNATLARVP